MADEAAAEGKSLAQPRRTIGWRWPQEVEGKNVGRLALLIVGSAMILNTAFNLIASARGMHHPYSAFLYDPKDRFADFFKLAFSYPGGPLHPAARLWAMDGRFAWFLEYTRYHANGVYTHFHEPPLTTLMALSWRRLMSVMDPVGLFAVWIAVCLGGLAAVVAQVGNRQARNWWFAVLALANYPVAFMVDRGHIFALVCATALIAALLSEGRERDGKWVSLGLYAIAINLRPNVGLVPFALFNANRLSLGDALRLGAIVALIALGSLGLAHLLYPEYGIVPFIIGLLVYSALYISYDLGLAYGSSLFGAFKALLGVGGSAFWAPLAIVILLLAGIAVAERRDRLEHSSMIYLVSCAYCLGSPVFADYHLAVFLAPLVLLARQGGIRTRVDWTIFFGCCFVLAPKNYLFHPDRIEELPWSWQIIANPAVLLATAAYLLLSAFRGWRDTPLLKPLPGSAASSRPQS